MRTTTNSRVVFRGVALCASLLAAASAGAGRAAEGDVALSGKLRYNAVLEVAGDPQTTYEVTTAEYVFEAGPATVGIPQPLDHELVRQLCGDKDGCEISLQMVNWDPVGEPEAVASRTSWMFLAELPAAGDLAEGAVGPRSIPGEPGTYWRFDELQGVIGTDNDPSFVGHYWTSYDCRFTDGESGSGDNELIDIDPGFALLNCENIVASDCTFSDTTTICRVVMRD